MTERTGIVVKTENNTYAHVATDRKSACGGGCHVIKSACYGCLSTSTKVISRVANPVGAKVGDLVKIKLSASRLYTAAAIFYLLPVMAIMIGGLSGIYTAQVFSISENLASIGGASIGLAIALIIVAIIGRLPTVSKQIEPVITTIVTLNAAQPGSRSTR